MVDVRDDRGLEPEPEERAVALVGLDDEPLPGVEPGVGPDLVELTADEEARVHTRQRMINVIIDVVVVLPWVPATPSPPHRDDPGERIGARQHGDPRALRGDDLDVSAGHGRADHDRVGVGRHVRGDLGDEALDPEQAQAVEP